ncbi:related to C6 transcription factor [Phialocephala subalpina]|uniref:Related to C6 transcription factor n=1 Tax=Phialocephala subalpina TaxID=576137 RepID=A0A1L7X196_9HELO|nr:related to C6 transcription factor [Phialocephala subalpina]
MSRSEVKGKAIHISYLCKMSNRLKCDFRTPSCGPCIRAQMPCSGYRDTQRLRIRNESNEVKRKAIVKRSPPVAVPRSLPLGLEVQARNAFFLNYVTGTLKSWDFLKQFSNHSGMPNHLRLSIDAVSLAYLSHQVYSGAAMALARERYISALRQMNKTLQCQISATDETALLSSLLLDLYEKITNFEPQGYDQSWTSHVNGALTLVKLRGLRTFQEPWELRVLARLSTNLLISCVASEAEVPQHLIEVRAYCGERLNANDPKWRLSDVMVCYANLRSHVSRGDMALEEQIYLGIELDSRLRTLTFEMPPEWRYETTHASTTNFETVWESRIDKYPDRQVTQTWNVCRLVRILLNEPVLEYCTSSSGGFKTASSNSMLVTMAKANIEALSEEICASVSQYLECHCQPAWKQPSPNVDIIHRKTTHAHTPAEKLDCYTLIFPLYIVGRSKYTSVDMKLWIVKQLQHMGIHFDIRNAGLVGRTLELGWNVDPWKIYAMLGSYAFVA